MNKQRALHHLNHHYSRQNTIARDMIGSIGFGFIVALFSVTGIIVVLGNADRIESVFYQLISWIVLKLSL